MQAPLNQLRGRMGALLAASMVLSVQCLAVSSLAEEPAILNIGDAVVTNFSGLKEPTELLPPPSTETMIDETLINLDGISAQIVSLAAPAFVWDARVWPAEVVRSFKSADIGQVFGVALDDVANPNIYFAASSAYGLHIVAPDADGDRRPERLKQGSKDAVWMPGMWGGANIEGGPGSIWKVDGTTAEVTLFANVMLEGTANVGPGLGNIAYDSAHKQLFVSDLGSGMIHRFDLDGNELEIYDHGVTGRKAAELEPVPYDPKGRLDITSGDFDSEDPETWGYTDARRRVWGLTVHDGRLFYAVTGDSQIWSIGLDKETGRFLDDPHWELDVPVKPKNLPVSDMLFTHKGAMVLAQRGEISSTYDYANFANPGKARLYRYWLENPDDPKTPSRWIAEPEEYAVGFEDNNRSTDGGIDLNHGYTIDGYLDPNICEASLWTTGDNLRRNKPLQDALLPGGPLVIDGLQGMPAGPVKDRNTPPWVTYMLDNDNGNTAAEPGTTPFNYSDTNSQGWMGDVAIYRAGCDGAGTGTGDSTTGYWGGSGDQWSDPPYVDECTPGEDCPVTECTSGVDCPPPPPQACLVPQGRFTCDESTGSWRYEFKADALPGLNADTISVIGTSPGITVANGPELPVSDPSTILDVTGATAGQLVSLNLCLFDKEAMTSGQPFDCCKTTVTVRYPARACVKK